MRAKSFHEELLNFATKIRKEINFMQKTPTSSLNIALRQTKYQKILFFYELLC